MQLLWRTLLAIIFPAPSLARWTQRVLAWLQRIDALLTNPEAIADLQTREGRLKLESQLALGEDWINFLINARTAELLGHRYTYHDREGRFWTPATPRSWASLMQRYQRLCASLGSIERLALRRANRIRREIEASPTPSRCFASIHLSRAPRGGGKAPALVHSPDFLLQCFALGEVDCAPLRARRWGQPRPRTSLIALDCRLPIPDCLAATCENAPARA